MITTTLDSLKYFLNMNAEDAQDVLDHIETSHAGPGVVYCPDCDGDGEITPLEEIRECQSCPGATGLIPSGEFQTIWEAINRIRDRERPKVPPGLRRNQSLIGTQTCEINLGTVIVPVEISVEPVPAAPGYCGSAEIFGDETDPSVWGKTPEIAMENILDVAKDRLIEALERWPDMELFKRSRRPGPTA